MSLWFVLTCDDLFDPPCITYKNAHTFLYIKYNKMVVFVTIRIANSNRWLGVDARGGESSRRSDRAMYIIDDRRCIVRQADRQAL